MRVSKRLGSKTTFMTLLIVVIWGTTSVAQRFDEQYTHWPVDLKINGRIIIDNGVRDFADSQQQLARVANNSRVVCFCHKAAKGENNLAEALKDAVGDDGSVNIVPFTDLPCDAVREALSAADVVVLQAGESGVGESTAWLAMKPDFDEFLANGHTLVTDASVAKLLGRVVVPQSSSTETITAEPGLNLLPDCLLVCEFDGQDASQENLLNQVTAHPRSVGIGLEGQTLLVLSGRRIACYGNGKATFILAAHGKQPPRIESIVPRRSRRQSPQEYLLDLTQWRREAIDRTIAPFPPAKPRVPLVENGTLLIVGGGGMPRGLMDRFIELAGGQEHAKLVYVPCTEADDVGERQSTVQSWTGMGVKHATFVHTKDRLQANTDPEFLAPLKEATGIWFGGGRQWNFSDSYYGTQAQKLMKEVLHRGGVIGGSSAGASIQARYLARATPIGNMRIMAPGYERGGLGFISGVAIDQHFSQRGRQKDMTQLMSRHPQLLGIGLDEATAIIVQKSEAEVVGRGRVYFYDRRLPVVADKPDYIALPAGSKFDLAKRVVVVDATKPQDLAPAADAISLPPSASDRAGWRRPGDL